MSVLELLVIALVFFLNIWLFGVYGMIGSLIGLFLLDLYYHITGR